MTASDQSTPPLARLLLCAHHGIPHRLFPAERLGGLLDVLSDGTVSNQTAKAVLREMVLVRAHRTM